MSSAKTGKTTGGKTPAMVTKEAAGRSPWGLTAMLALVARWRDRVRLRCDLHCRDCRAIAAALPPRGPPARGDIAPPRCHRCHHRRSGFAAGTPTLCRRSRHTPRREERTMAVFRKLVQPRCDSRWSLAFRGRPRAPVLSGLPLAKAASYRSRSLVGRPTQPCRGYELAGGSTRLCPQGGGGARC